MDVVSVSLRLLDLACEVSTIMEHLLSGSIDVWFLIFEVGAAALGCLGMLFVGEHPEAVTRLNIPRERARSSTRRAYESAIGQKS